MVVKSQDWGIRGGGGVLFQRRRVRSPGGSGDRFDQRQGGQVTPCSKMGARLKTPPSKKKKGRNQASPERFVEIGATCQRGGRGTD